MQIYTGLDLSRKRVDWHACRADGTPDCSRPPSVFTISRKRRQIA